MGHKVKLRVTLNSGKAEKIGFTLDEGKIFRLNGEVPGMAILASLMGDPETSVCRMTIKGNALVVSRSSKGPELIVNEQTVEEAKIRKGDILKYDNGTVEFMECPLWAEPEQSTKFVSLESSDATAVMQNPNTTRFIATPEKADEHTSVNASIFHPVDSNHKASEDPNVNAKSGTEEITSPVIPATKAGNTALKTKDDATAKIMRSQVFDPERRKSKRRSDEQDSAVYTSGNTEISDIKKALYKHIAISAAIIAVCGEISSLIAFGFKYDFSPIPTPYSGLMLITLFSGLSAAFFYGNRYIGTSGRFEQYLRTFAWFSLYLVPYAFCFGFPKSVIVFASVLISIIWTGLFSLRYFGEIPKFIPASVGTWIVIIASGFHFVSSLQIQSIHSQAMREIASDQASEAQNSPAEAPQAMSSGTPAVVAITPSSPQVTAPQAISTTTPQVVAPQVAPAQAPAAPMAAAPFSTQELAQQATSLSLDPMAQERFFNAVKSGNLNMVESMVERRVIDPVFTLDHGSTALHFAAAQGDLRMVSYLVSKKVNLDAQDAGGTTALMWATYKHFPKVVAYLIKQKANLQIRREGGDRALEIARSTEDREIVTMLKEAMNPRKIASVKSKKRSR